MENPIYVLEEQGDITVFTLKMEDMTMQQERELIKDFFDLIKEGKTKMVLDLSSIEYISSVGIAAIVSILKRTRKEECDLVISGGNDKIQDILRVTHVDKLFNMVNDVGDAVKKLKHPNLI